MSATGVSLDLLRELRGISGEDFVAENANGSLDVCPGSAEEVAAILRLANQRGFGVTPAGGGSEFDPSAARSEVTLHTDRLTEVEHYDPADLTVGVGAGTTVAQLNRQVGVDQLMFACDPPMPQQATIGGILATAAQGPMRHGYGALRDFCIGIRFVTGDGRKAKGGGRVVKNVAGYDLMKLLIGSYGTLAVITSASFKLFPAPRQTRTFLAEFASWQEALKFRDLILRSPLAPMCLELVSPGARKVMRPEMTDDAWVIRVRSAGSEAALARHRKELGSAITRELDGEPEAQMWRAIENFPRLRGEGAVSDGWCYGVVNAPIAEVGTAIEWLQALDTADGRGVGMIGRVGVGHLLFACRASDAANLTKGTQPMSRDCSIRWHGPGRVDSLNSTQLPAMRAVKHALDPNSVLRGRENF